MHVKLYRSSSDQYVEFDNTKINCNTATTEEQTALIDNLITYIQTDGIGGFQVDGQNVSGMAHSTTGGASLIATAYFMYRKKIYFV